MCVSETTAFPSSDHSAHASCCGALSHALGSKILYNTVIAYNASLASYYSARESDLHPDCIVSATSAADVSTAVGILTHFNTHTQQYNTASNCHFAIRGGGHTPWPGSANIQGGVTIDLSRISQVQVSENRTITNVGGGARWEDVYRYLDSLDLAVVGGRVSTVGVGGLTLGGGISFFSPRFGFVCDRVESFELVGAGGKIYSDVSETSHPDLYRALKGGSNNFGIVTNFRLRTFPSGNIWGGSVTYDVSTIADQFAAFESLTASADYDPYATVIMSLAFYEGQMIPQNFYSYTKIPAPASTPTFLKPLVTLKQTSSTLRIAPLHNLTNEVSPGKDGARYLFATMSFAINATFMHHVHDLGETLFKALTTTVPGLLFAISFQPLPQIITSKSNATGGNVLGITPADGNLVNVLVPASWTNVGDDSTVQTAARKMITQAVEEAKRMGISSQVLYLNYAAEWQDPIGRYGEENVKSLRRVSKVYDPHGVFQNAVPGGFKLWS